MSTPEPSSPSTSRAGGSRRWLVALLVFGAFVAFIIVMSQVFDGGGPPRESISYSTFLDHVRDDRVIEVTIESTQIDGAYREEGTEMAFTTTRPPDVIDDDLLNELEAHGVDVEGSSEGGGVSAFVSALGWLLPMFLLIGVWIYIMRRMAGGGGAGAMKFGRSKAKIVDRSDLHTSFDDVAGVDEAVEELGEIVDFLRSPEKYQRLGGHIPKGVILVGPPGTGKTLLARAVAGEASVPFFTITGSGFVELFVGVGAARVRDLFEQAKASAPCIVFIDEIDTIGRSRAGPTGGFGAHEEREQTLNQLLAEMDGFDPSSGVIIMAATNRPEVLDPALLRAGRFDRQVVIDRPDRRGRAAILRVHTRHVNLALDVDLRTLAARTPGFAGAELANVVNEAALLSARKGLDTVGMRELEEAIDRVSIGLERRSRIVGEQERDRVAHHEIGHALVALLLPHADPVHCVSIVPRGAMALGTTQQLPAEDRYVITEPELSDRLAVLMGGRAAERLVYGDVSTGAQNDLREATALARRMVEEFGMSTEIGPLTLSRQGGFSPLEPRQTDVASPELASLADREVRRLLDGAEERATGLLAKHNDVLESLSALLLEHETLEGEELSDALNDRLGGDAYFPAPRSAPAPMPL
ncbi:MAG: ATP-dependent zinc metalloprotease FtsH [Gaiellaceae bacterium]